MTYELELLKGSYGGVPFLINDESISGGQRIQQTSSMASGGLKYTNALSSSGLRANEFTLTLIINEKALNVNLKDHVKSLTDKLSSTNLGTAGLSDSSGKLTGAQLVVSSKTTRDKKTHKKTTKKLNGHTLIVPFWGVVPNVVCGEWALEHSLENIGEASISATFFVVQKPGADNKDSILSLAIKKLKHLNSKVLEYENIFTKTTNPDQLVRLSGQVNAFISELNTIPNLAIPILDAYRTITNNLRVFLSDPVSMSDYVTKAYEATDAETPPDYNERSQALKDMKLKDPDVYPSELGTAAKKANDNIRLVHSLFLTIFFLMACEAAVNRTYVLKSEIDDEKAFLLSILIALGTPDDLEEIFASVGKILGLLAINTFNIVDYDVSTATSSKELSYRVLGDESYAPYIEALNSDLPPYRMKGKVKVIV